MSLLVDRLFKSLGEVASVIMRCTLGWRAANPSESHHARHLELFSHQFRHSQFFTTSLSLLKTSPGSKLLRKPYYQVHRVNGECRNRFPMAQPIKHARSGLSGLGNNTTGYRGH